MLNGAAEVQEEVSNDPRTAVPIGYSQSKWVAEQLCNKANAQSPGRCQILRVGQLCGDKQNGIWNEKEGWPLMLKTALTTGTLPIIKEVSCFCFGEV